MDFFNIGTLVCVGDVAVSLSRGLTGLLVCLRVTVTLSHATVAVTAARLRLRHLRTYRDVELAA